MTETTRTLEILDRLIAFPTVSRDSNLELIDWVEDLLRHAGFGLTRIWAPDRRKAGLFARIGPSEGGGVCLSAHTDVVPVDGQSWTRPPFRLTREGERLFGRGTTDMKGFLASALAMAERSAKTSLSEPLSLVISYDEEIGCVGIRQMMPELAPLLGAPRAVIVGEPTSMQVATGHKGKAALGITCHGQAGHSALAPQFVNAIHVAAGFVQEIRALQAELAEGPKDPAFAVPFSTLHVGKIEGGRALNIVPDRAGIDMELRHIAEVPPGDIRARIEAAARKVEQAIGPAARIEIDEVAAYPGLDTGPDNPVVKWASRLVGAPQTCKVAFGTEAGFFAELGHPTVVVGPGDMARDGHKPDEGVDSTELTACDAMLDRVRADLSRG